MVTLQWFGSCAVLLENVIWRRARVVAFAELVAYHKLGHVDSLSAIPSTSGCVTPVLSVLLVAPRDALLYNMAVHQTCLNSKALEEAINKRPHAMLVPMLCCASGYAGHRIQRSRGGGVPEQHMHGGRGQNLSLCTSLQLTKQYVQL